MNTFFRTTALALCSTFVLVTATLPAGAAEATPARVTFDGQIRNNSLALSPDEATAVVSYSERPDVIVYDLVTAYEGSISAEHGIGALKRDELAQRKSPVALTLMRSIKQALDPQGLMNPGKVI